ncbi:MAG TPA: T9SS type A sorting domain-containing protein [Bacteroides sp.]|nr:T9SS type A sorting domain-containing protein [Bacteroides sp.]
MKKITPLILGMAMSSLGLQAQHLPTIGTPLDDTLFVGSGPNFLLVPDVDDGEAGADQDFSFRVTSSEPSILQVDSVSFTTGHTFAVIHVTEQGVMGSVTIQSVAEDPDGTDTASFRVTVGPYRNPGIKFEIHDIVFWQQFVPLEANPAFSMIAESGEAPYDQIDLASLDLSVYADCQTSPPCTGTDFFTAMFRGYLTPPVTGDYYFYMVAGDQCSIGLSGDEYFDHASVILHSSDGIGTSSGNKEWKSVQVSLEAGKVYAIYGTHWNIHTPMGGMLWEGPGISKQYIPGQYLAHVYDHVSPSAPGTLELVNTGLTDIRCRWEEATDDSKVTGYNLYLNGWKVNEHLIRGTEYQASGLHPATRYAALVTALDAAGNESMISNTVLTTTYLEDEVPPFAPGGIQATVVSDISVQLAWEEAVDGETEIRGYNLYLDDVLYNTEDLIYAEEALVEGLVPETGYSVTLEAVDAGYNVSPKSDPLVVTTSAFDPYDISLTDKKARMRVTMEVVGRNDGLGVNPDYITGEFIDDPQQVELIRELEPAAIRWGALTANPLNFSDYIGTGKAMTFGRFMAFCNEVNAYSVITCGVENSTDWMTDPETFVHFLEYVAGPADSEYGAIRVAEGYNESLLEGSRGLVFEFGNEVWGATAHDAQIGSDYTVYGAWCREMARLMKSSEYYDPGKICLVYSGRNPHPSDSYGLNEKLMTGDTGEVDWLAVSGYLGGNLNYSPEIDPGESELDYYKNGYVAVHRNLEGLVETMRETVQASGEIKPTYMYEANMTTSSYFGRLGQAIVQTGYYAEVMETGGVIPTLFQLTGGQWKMVVPSQDYYKTPLFHTAAYFNRYCKGHILKTGVDTRATIRSSPGAEKPLEPVGCHAYTEDGRYAFLLFSRDFEHDFVVQLDLPDGFQPEDAGAARKYVITGEGFSAREAVIDSAQITVSDGMLVEVPAYSMVVITFGAEDLQEDPLPAGHYIYTPATSVNIYAYNTEIFDISGREKKIFLASVEPDSAFSDVVKWEMDTAGVRVTYGLKSYGFEVQGSGTCDGNGTVTLKAMAWDNPEVYDQVTINISNQGTNCGTGTEDSPGRYFSLYPNPASENLYLENLPGHTGLILVTDLTGRKCMTRNYAGSSLELDLSGLTPGLYDLSVTGTGDIVHRKFLKE